MMPLNDLQDAFHLAIAEAMAKGDLNESEIENVTEKVVQRALPRVSSLMLKTLKRAAPKMLRKRGGMDAGFRRRNHRRWRRAFDLLEMMWVIAEEVGANFNETYRPEAARNSDYQFEALTFLHARSLLVVREIICLMHGGHPDGALSRWRTLHELAVTATFLGKHGPETAHRYLASHYFNAYSAAT